jgi:short-subunit dehydrogenase
MNHEGLALIICASRGLGMAFARELADRHHNLVLVARSIEPLRALASELRQSNPITVSSLRLICAALVLGSAWQPGFPAVSIVWRKR